MALYDNLTNLYSLSKTLRFELKPYGKTLENVQKSGILEEDIHRAESYKKIKKVIDEYHKAFIEEALSEIHLSGIDSYMDLYMKNDKTDNEKKQLLKVEESLRKEVVKCFRAQGKYGSLFNKDLVKKELKEFDKENIALIQEFEEFTTYFKGFNQNRENMYSDEAKSTAIGYRLINQNLPKYIDNIRAFQKLKVIAADVVETMNPMIINPCFEILEYHQYTTQTGIDRYNRVVGQLNQLVNEYNQKHRKDGKLAKFKVLYKQILSDREKVFLVESFSDDEEVFEAVNSFLDNAEGGIANLQILLKTIDTFDKNQIYVRNDGSMTKIAQVCYENWNAINQTMVEQYDREYLKGKKLTQKYEEKREKFLKNIDSYSLGELESAIETVTPIYEYFSNDELFNRFSDSKEKFALLNPNMYGERKLIKDENAIQVIKNLLDSIKEIQWFVKPLLGSGKEPDKNLEFYNEFEYIYGEIDKLTDLYNKVRNYVTQKPYSTEKIKLNFRKSTLLDGWDKNKEKDNLGVIFKKGGKFYLGIMDKKHTKILDNIGEPTSNDTFDKVVYKLLPGPNKMLPKVFFADSNAEKFKPSSLLLDKYQEGTHKKGENFDINDCRNLIDFFKGSISIHDDWSKFDFNFSDTNSYEDLSKFYKEVEHQGYKITYERIDCEYIDKLVNEGQLYLFQIYNKDFSEYSKGKPNLHTLYWKMLFDEENLKDVVYKLNGEAEIFFRKSSIEEENRTIHKANEPIAKKREENKGEFSEFEYDLIKDKRYTVDRFQFHVPITMNFKAAGIENINQIVNQTIQEDELPYVIGIDRGERHLLYLVVINPKGEIVEQYSLNQIKSEYNEKVHTVDYKNLLEKKEKERDSARKDWKTIENIKELKEGYLSQVIHVITELMMKYNAVIVLENLDMGFMRSRQKVERQVYQKFEKMLIDKLNYLVSKDKSSGENGGLLNAYQLTNKFDSFQKLGKQSGVLFYIPAWNTSKMDPTTGFVNLFYLHYKNVEDSKKFWNKFEHISFNKEEGYFEFDFDYNNFTTKAEGTKTKWTVCTYGTRIKTFRNSEKLHQWDNEEVNITEEFLQLFNKYHIDIESECLIDQMIAIESADFHKDLLHLFKLTLQMRNSITNSDVDYLISPIKNSKGKFFNSNDCIEGLPKDADANGAYNIARKGLWAMTQIKYGVPDSKGNIKIDISNKEWLKYAQENING